MSAILQDKAKHMVPEDERISKLDLITLESLVMDSKNRLEELIFPDPETLPSKEDFITLQ